MRMSMAVVYLVACASLHCNSHADTWWSGDIRPLPSALRVRTVVDALGDWLPGTVVHSRTEPVGLTGGAHQLFGSAGDGGQEYRADVVTEHRTKVEGLQRLAGEGGQIFGGPAQRTGHRL